MLFYLGQSEITSLPGCWPNTGMAPRLRTFTGSRSPFTKEYSDYPEMKGEM
jgi:hypothetical protein